MKVDSTIPIVVSVTGHRKIREQDRTPLCTAVKTELQRLQKLCPHSRIVMLSALAEGGDLICADAAEELGIPLIAALPRDREDYEKDFSVPGRERFSHHCARAEQLFAVPYTEETPEGGISRDFLFRQAGIYVAAHGHVMLALWDGGPGTEAACGTAEAVDFVLNGSYSPRTDISVRSESNGAVIHIFTPRGAQTGEPAGTVHFLGNWDMVKEILRKTDDFNQQTEKVSVDSASRLPETAADDACLARMEKISLTAGKRSRFYAKRFRMVLALLAVSSALLTFMFLLYDEAEMIWMILGCGIMLAAAWACQRYASRSDCHRRYLEYRALAECLRVQTYLRYAGSSVQAQDLLSWTQQEETAWIMVALCALTAGDAPKRKHDIRECWVEDQRSYHRNAEKRSLYGNKVSDRVVHTAFFLSVLLYFAAVGFELISGNQVLPAALPVSNVERYRTILKISLGTISAVTLFVSNYYGRMSLPRTLSDHRKMERFYGRISALLLQHGQTEKLLTVLAREELIENGNWCSYQRDNKPDISI